MIRILYSVDCTLATTTDPNAWEKTWIRPVGKLLACCREVGLPLTLFQDVACLWRFRELGLTELPDAAQAQARAALEQSGDVQLLLHPHWAFARLAEGRFSFPPHTYLLGSLAREPEARRLWTLDALQRAKSHLEEQLRPVQPRYRCIAFRAGGFALQPEERMVLGALQQAGFLLESSVVPGWRFHSPIQTIDFTGVPCLGNYWLSERTGLEQPAAWGEGVLEIPVAAAGLDPATARRVNGGEALRAALGVLLGASGWRWRQAWQQARRQWSQRFLRLELGAGDHVRLLACVEQYLKCLDDRTSQIVFTFHCHPRNVSGETLEALLRFHWGMVARYGSAYAVGTYGQAAEYFGQKRKGDAPLV